MEKTIKVGDKIKPITLTDHNGRKQIIGGKQKTVIFFFPKAHTSG